VLLLLLTLAGAPEAVDMEFAVEEVCSVEGLEVSDMLDNLEDWAKD
jgi:hypothetical protein